MNEKELLTKKFIKVSMNDVQISTDDKPIIGTDSLATCTGVLLYSEIKKRAIVAHVACETKNIFYRSLELAYKNGFNDAFIKYKIIPGYYFNHYETKKELDSLYGSIPNLLIPFDEKDIPEGAIIKDEKTPSLKFAFDASSGKFVTDKVCFGKEYIDINENNISTK